MIYEVPARIQTGMTNSYNQPVTYRISAQSYEEARKIVAEMSGVILDNGNLEKKMSSDKGGFTGGF